MSKRKKEDIEEDHVGTNLGEYSSIGEDNDVQEL
jgi:hypothetical protein